MRRSERFGFLCDNGPVKRLAWIDATRGLGMVAVVLGHTITGRPQNALYWFHMPLFFIVSGFVYRMSGTWADYAGRRARQLLVPYVAWLLILSAPGLFKAFRAGDVGPELKTLFFGGAGLAGPTGTLWFLTALYVALVLYDGLRRHADRFVTPVVTGCYLLAVARAYFEPKLLLPLSLEAVLVALPFIHVGAVARAKGWAERPAWLGGAAAFFFVFLVGASLWQWPPVFDLKNGFVGLPGVAFLVAVAGTAAVALLAQNLGPSTDALGYVGRASLLVMLVHPWILSQFVKRDLGPEALRFAVALAVPLLLYPVFRRFTATRVLLLGEAEARPTAPPFRPV